MTRLWNERYVEWHRRAHGSTASSMATPQSLRIRTCLLLQRRLLLGSYKKNAVKYFFVRPTTILCVMCPYSTCFVCQPYVHYCNLHMLIIYHTSFVHVLYWFWRKQKWGYHNDYPIMLSLFWVTKSFTCLQEQGESAGGESLYGVCFIDTSIGKFHVSSEKNVVYICLYNKIRVNVPILFCFFIVYLIK